MTSVQPALTPVGPDLLPEVEMNDFLGTDTSSIGIISVAGPIEVTAPIPIVTRRVGTRRPKHESIHVGAHLAIQHSGPVITPRPKRRFLPVAEETLMRAATFIGVAVIGMVSVFTTQAMIGI